MSYAATRIPDDVQQILSKSRFERNHVFLPADLERAMYQRVNKTLTGLGAKWDKRAKAHVLPAGKDAGQIFGAALASGLFVDEKKEYEIFETPAALAAEMAEAVVKRGDITLEPSAGSGRLVTAAFAASAKLVVAHEIRESACAALAREWSVVGSSLVIQRGDFTHAQALPHGLYDSCVMNPPFSNQQDVTHVMRAFEMLKRGGRLIAVTSPGWTFREGGKAKAFRDLVKRYGSSEKLPERTFRESGTDVETLLVRLTKRG